MKGVHGLGIQNPCSDLETPGKSTYSPLHKVLKLDKSKKWPRSYEPLDLRIVDESDQWDERTAAQSRNYVMKCEEQILRFELRFFAK